MVCLALNHCSSSFKISNDTDFGVEVMGTRYPVLNKEREAYVNVTCHE